MYTYKYIYIPSSEVPEIQVAKYLWEDFIYLSQTHTEQYSRVLKLFELVTAYVPLPGDVLDIS